MSPRPTQSIRSIRRKKSRSTHKPACIMGIWDLHFPYHDPSVFDLFLQVAADYRPDILIMGGDGIDATSVSGHNPSAKVRVEQPIDLDIEGFNREILAPLDSIGAKRKIFFFGNHERMLSDYSELHPEIGKALDLEKQLRLEERGWLIVPYKKFWIAPGGKIAYNHGDLRTMRRSGGLTKHHSFDMAVKTHRCTRYGHAHTLQSYTIPNQLEPDFPINGLSLPCACRTDLPYLENSAVNWVQGFYIGWIRPTGKFNDFAIVVVDGQCSFAGKSYSSRITRRKAA